MNELDIIRSQLAVQQTHAAEVANACAAAFGEVAAPFREACVSYLVWVLAQFEERDQTLSETPSSHHLAGLLSRPGTSREALSRLEAALAAGESAAARASWQEFARFFNSAWVPRRGTLDAALAENLSMADLRAVCAIDADSILEERNRFAGVAALLPSGIELRRA
jgi:hypothetical protein